MSRPLLKKKTSALKPYYSVTRENSSGGAPMANTGIVPGPTLHGSYHAMSNSTRDTHRAVATSPPHREPRTQNGLGKLFRKSMFPVLVWGPQYTARKLVQDIISGITLASFQIPLSISLSTLAGLPPQSGLFSLIIPPMVYVVFGTVPSLVIGPQAVASMIVGHHIEAMTEQLAAQGQVMVQGAELRLNIHIVSIITFTCGALLLGVGLGKYGFIDNALSKSFQRGFISSLAFTMFISSLMTELGLNAAYRNRPVGIEKNGTSWNKLTFIWENLAGGTINNSAMWISIATVVFLVSCHLMKKFYAKRYPKVVFFPEILLVVVVSTWLSKIFQWDVKRVGDLLTKSSVEIHWPLTSFQTFRDSFDTAVLITTIGIFETATAYKTITEQSPVDVSSNKELFAVGLSNFFCSLVGSLPSFGGYGRTKLNILTGVATPFSGLVVSLLSFLIMCYCLQWFYYLPQCSLASIITMISLTLLEELPKELYFYWRVKGYKEIVVVFTVITFTLVWSPQMGITVGLGITMVVLLQQTTKSNITILGKDPNTNQFKPIVKLSSTADGSTDSCTVNPGDLESASQATLLQRSYSTSSVATLGERIEFEKIMIVEVPSLLNFANITDFKKRLIKLEKYGPSSSSKNPAERYNSFFNPQSDNSTANKSSSSPLLLPVTKPSYEPLKYLIIDFENIHTIDISAIQSLLVIVQSYTKREIFVFFTNAPKLLSLRGQFQESGIFTTQKILIKNWLADKNDLPSELISMVETDFFESIEEVVNCIDYMEYVSANNDI